MKNNLILLAALALAGCDVSPNQIYHITCYSGGTKIYEGEATNPNGPPGETRFYDEDGQHLTIDGDCIIETNKIRVPNFKPVKH